MSEMNTRRIEDMEMFEKARWYSLMEAVNIIGDECDERGIDFDTLKVSPLDLQKYIEKTCDIFARKLEEEEAQEHKKNVYFNLQKLAAHFQKI